MTLYKIVPAALWRSSEAARCFRGSPVDLGDGFIHFSTAAQVRETAAKHFAGASDLLLVAVEASGGGQPSGLPMDLRWEPSRGGALFPHLYGDLMFDAVQWVKPLPLGADGLHVFPAFDE